MGLKIALQSRSLLLAVVPLFVPSISNAEDRDIENGEILYQENCASCHGVDLEGQPDWQSPNDEGILPAPPHNESGHTWHHSDQILFDYTKYGGTIALEMAGVSGFESGMPGFSETLSDEEIWNILAYIRSTWPEEIQDIQSSR